MVAGKIRGPDEPVSFAWQARQPFAPVAAQRLSLFLFPLFVFSSSASSDASVGFLPRPSPFPLLALGSIWCGEQFLHGTAASEPATPSPAAARRPLARSPNICTNFGWRAGGLARSDGRQRESCLVRAHRYRMIGRGAAIMSLCIVQDG